MGSTPHYFIAIHLPETLQDYLSSWQEDLRAKLPYRQWYHKKDLHITLKFLGAVEDAKLTALIQGLKSIERLRAFALHIGSIGTFGNSKKPRVLWAGVESNDTLLQLYHAIENIAVDCGFAKENRSYRPHITLAKKWSAKGPIDELDEVLQQQKVRYPGTKILPVNEVVIFRIYPGQEPKYRSVATFQLKQ